MTKLGTSVRNPHADKQIPRATHLEWGQCFLSHVQGHILAVVFLLDQ